MKLLMEVDLKSVADKIKQAALDPTSTLYETDED